MIYRNVFLLALLCAALAVPAAAQPSAPPAVQPAPAVQPVAPAPADPAPPAPATPVAQPPAEGVLLPDTADPATGAPYGRYRIQANDTLSIAYRYSPEYDFTGQVQPDGFISPPLLGEVMVAGLTLDEARDRVVEKARQRLRDPEVFVVLKDFERPSFAVGGEVDKPGRFALRGRVGVLEAIAMAGGLKSSAKHSKVVLIRRFDPEHVVTREINVKQMQRRGTDEANIELQAGDFLMVPKSGMSKFERLIPLASLALLSPLIWRWL